MRGFRAWPRSWRKAVGGGLITLGIVLWVAGAEASTNSFAERARLDIVVGGAIAAGGIVVIGTEDRRGYWYDQD